MEKPADIFKVLGVETRLKIIDLLKTRQQMGVNELSEQLGITPAAVSQHLKILKHAGMVRSERQGYRIPYSLNEETLNSCNQIVADVCCCNKTHGDHLHHHPPTAPCREDVESLKKYKNELEEELLRIEKLIEKQK